MGPCHCQLHTLSVLRDSRQKREGGIRTASFLDEGLCALGCFLFLEVDDGEGGAAGADEGAAELVSETAGAACDEGDLGEEGDVSEETCRLGKWGRTLPAMEKSGRYFSLRALAATSLDHRT